MTCFLLEVEPIFHIKVIAVGKIKEKYLEAGIGEYQKRLDPFVRLEILEIRDEGGSSLKMGASLKNEVLSHEGKGIRGKIGPGEHVIALDREGRSFSSAEFSRYLARLASLGQSKVTFLIGGSIGLDPLLLKEADMALSFSSLTFPHQLFRLLLMEQLYRAFTIMRGHPYHK